MQLLVPEVDLPAVPAVLDRVALRPSYRDNRANEFVLSHHDLAPAVAVERAREATRPLPAQGSGNLYLTRDPKGRTVRAAGDGCHDHG
jgi:hypothetical protein